MWVFMKVKSISEEEQGSLQSIYKTNLFPGLPPYRGGMVCVLQLPLELCRLESWTPIKVTHTEQVKG